MPKRRREDDYLCNDDIYPLMRDYRDVMTELTRLKKRYKSAMYDLDCKHDELDYSEGACDELQDKNDKLKRENDDLKREVDMLRKNNDMLDTMNSTLKRDNKRIKNDMYRENIYLNDVVKAKIRRALRMAYDDNHFSNEEKQIINMCNQSSVFHNKINPYIIIAKLRKEGIHGIKYKHKRVICNDDKCTDAFFCDFAHDISEIAFMDTVVSVCEFFESQSANDIRHKLNGIKESLVVPMYEDFIPV